VFLNGRSVGTTPLVLRNQAAGSRAVRVAMDGYESWSSAVRVVADTETRLEGRAESPALVRAALRRISLRGTSRPALLVRL
jgi:hypothetical protein